MSFLILFRMDSVKEILRMAPLIFSVVLCLDCDGGQRNHDAEDRPSPPMTGVFRIGVSVKDITPRHNQIESGEINMGGYGYLGIRDFGLPLILSKATGVHDRIYVRTTLIELDGNAFAIAAIDAAGIGNKIIHEISSMTSRVTGLRESGICIANTHSHNAPDLQGYCGGVSEEYRSFVIDQTVAAISEASKNRAPAHLYVSLAQGKSDNRRGWGYTDASIVVLEARRIVTDETLCVLINFGCHPTVLDSGDTEISRDYTGYLVDYAETKLGAPVIFLQGALGDSTPHTKGLAYESEFEKAQAFGVLIAEEALAGMENQARVDTELHIDTFTFKHAISNSLLIATYLLLGTRLEYDVEYDLVEGLSIQTQVRYARLGNQVQIGILPGESLTNHALSIKQAMTAPFRMILCQTTDSLGYLIPTDEWHSAPNGESYEETFVFDRHLGDTTRDQLIEMIGSDPTSREEVKGGGSLSSERPSSVVLPIVSGVEVPTERPALNALRGQPCRDYVPSENTTE
jgi:hypothetical protein